MVLIIILILSFVITHSLLLELLPNSNLFNILRCQMKLASARLIDDNSYTKFLDENARTRSHACKQLPFQNQKWYYSFEITPLTNLYKWWQIMYPAYTQVRPNKIIYFYSFFLSCGNVFFLHICIRLTRSHSKVRWKFFCDDGATSNPICFELFYLM